MKKYMKDEIRLSYLNGGKSFKLPRMTLEIHEKWLEETAKLEKETKKKEAENFDKVKFDRLASKILVFEVLKDVIKDLTFDNIKKIHPQDFIELSNRIWESGKELKEEKEDFQ